MQIFQNRSHPTNLLDDLATGSALDGRVPKAASKVMWGFQRGSFLMHWSDNGTHPRNVFPLSSSCWQSLRDTPVPGGTTDEKNASRIDRAGPLAHNHRLSWQISTKRCMGTRTLAQKLCSALYSAVSLLESRPDHLLAWVSFSISSLSPGK
jgi:hypothetical protein